MLGADHLHIFAWLDVYELLVANLAPGNNYSLFIPSAEGFVMPYIRTTATEKILGLTARVQGVTGGTGASKTISILMKLIDLIHTDEKVTLTSVTSESLPHLKKGAIRDFQNIMVGRGYWQDARWNKSEVTYTFENGCQLEFFSSDSNKAHGPRRDRLFVNEGNHVRWSTVDQMMIRTRELIIIDWNPTNAFWWEEEVVPFRDHEFLRLTYKDNEALEPEIVKDIEAHKHNRAWWRVYGLGLTGQNEDSVFHGWLPIDEVPHEARLLRRGLDFGFTNHPSALVATYYWNGAYIFDEEMYRKGMSNQDIFDVADVQPQAQKLVRADAAEPKSIAELQMLGMNVIAAEKGPGSVNAGIQFIQNKRIFMTKRSVNGWKEYRNYMWIKDKEGKPTNEPEDAFNHFMDAARYSLEDEMPRREKYKKERFSTGNAEALIY